jgi:hypothetical protein
MLAFPHPALKIKKPAALALFRTLLLALQSLSGSLKISATGLDGSK